MNYESWLKQQPREFQRATLGPSRFDLWEGGVIKRLTDLVDQTGNRLTVEELIIKYGKYG